MTETTSPSTDEGAPPSAGGLAGLSTRTFAIGSAALVVAVVVGLVSVTTTPVPEEIERPDAVVVPEPDLCTTGRWPGAQTQPPAGLAEGEPGVYLWLRIDGWRLEVNGTEPVTGRIRYFGTEGSASVLTPDGAPDPLEVTPAAVPFELDPTVGRSTLVITAPCETKAFGLVVDPFPSGEQPPIYVGNDEEPAGGGSDTVLIERTLQ